MYRGGPYGIAGGGVWEQFPYANMHEWNIDFILRKLKTLEGRMALLDERMNSLESDMTELQQKMQQLREAMAALILKVEALEADLEATKSRIATLEADMVAAVNRIAALESGLDSIQNALDALTDRVSTLETSVSQINSAIETINGAIAGMSAGLEEVNSRIAALEEDGKVVNISAKFTQDGSLDEFRRSIYRINGITYGTMRFGGYHGTAEIEITVADEAMPAYGSFASYREEPRGTVDISHLIDTGYISSYIPSRKDAPINGGLPSKPDDFIRPLNKRAGSGFLIRVPNNVRLAMLEYPDCTCIIQFTYVAEDRL